MRSLKIVVGMCMFLAMISCAGAQGLKQKYLGKSSCDRDIQSERPDFSMGLDKSQKTYLIHRYLSNTKILLLVQLQGDTDKCGVIRDVVEIRDPSKEYEFSCVDPEVPSDVVIGTSKRKDSMKSLTAIEAWRIDLKKDTFNRVTHKVRCTNENPLDSEDRGDLAEQAKKRVAQRKLSPNGQTSQP
ncbi:MAG TPA: hypothetical protein VKP61_17375 [Candidatus Acidoferrum sp.]|nr:hypothetical protein [Candidatus Acidoferrum sp.]